VVVVVVVGVGFVAVEGSVRSEVCGEGEVSEGVEQAVVRECRYRDG
jgi:hypothetical protein